ncbi:MAG: AraC family transcriptional regulator, partial [Spirochaetaceae bacterium]|nr:AraC family transcriptional regulator [Spirochaetaceae bacterium]
NYFGIESVGKANPWRTITLVDKNTIKGKISYITKGTTIIIFLMFIIASSILIYITYLSKIPLLKMARHIKELSDYNEEGKDNISIISQFINDVSGKSSYIQRRISENRPFLENMFLANILNGDLKSSDLENMEIVKEIGLQIGQYRVILIRVGRKIALSSNKEREQELLIVKLGILDLLRIYREKGILSVNLDGQLIGIIQTGENKLIHDVIENLVSEIIGAIDEHLEIGVGLIKTELRNIYKSNYEASVALNIKSNEERRKIVYYSKDLMENNQFTFYPVQMEEKLKHMVESGLKEELSLSLKELMKLNLESKHADQINIKLFFSLLKGTLIRIIQDNNLNDEELIEKVRQVLLLSHERDSIKFEKFESVFHSLADSLFKNRTSKKDSLKKRIEEYIDENFSDINLSINAISSSFSYSPQYFSGIFKEIFATNFRTYLEDKRLNIFIDHLKQNPEKDLKEMISDVGYNSQNTFSKAFKRHFGISASEYRRNLR